MAHDVFICHASEDRAIADAVVAGLERDGITCWVAPRNVMPGSDYAEAIVAAISGARVLVLVFSQHSNRSPHVSREVERAVSRGIDIIPLRVEQVEPSRSLEYFISSAQWLDASSGSAGDYVGELAKIIRVRVYGEPGEGPRAATKEILRDLLDRYGPELTEDPRRLQALLRDVAGEHRAEVAALFAAAEEGVGAALLNSSQGLTPELVERLVRRLQQNRALAEDASRWAVNAWVYALGIQHTTPPSPNQPVPDQPGPSDLPETVAATPTPPDPTPPPVPAPAADLPQTVAATPDPPAPTPPQPLQPAVGVQGQPAQPLAPLPPDLEKHGRRRRQVAAFIGGGALVVVLIGGATIWMAGRGAPEALSFSPDEVYLEAADAVEYAFTSSLLTDGEVSEMAGPTTTLLSNGDAAVALVKGSDEFIYAATRGDAVCDTETLLDELGRDPVLSQAWVEAQGISSQDVSAFVAGLTPMMLTKDVRVTTHLFDDGQAIARQGLLQQGTAVLVGADAQPRVRCASGSPLRLPVVVSSPTFVGLAWPNFDPAKVIELEPCEEPLLAFVLQDPTTGEPFVRQIGSNIADVDITTTTTSTTTTTTMAPTTTSTTTTTTTTTLPVADHNATPEGSVTASSRLCGSFAAARAADGDLTTSWISSSGDGEYSTFQWTGTQDEYIGHVTVIGNAQNSTVSRRTNDGFAAVTVQVLDAAGAVVFEELVELPGTPDPDAVVEPRVVGRSVRLLLEGRENSSGSGFAELIVMVTRL